MVPKALNQFAFCKINFHPSCCSLLFFFFFLFVFLFISIDVLNLFLSSFNKI